MISSLNEHARFLIRMTEYAYIVVVGAEYSLIALTAFTHYCPVDEC